MGTFIFILMVAFLVIAILIMTTSHDGLGFGLILFLIIFGVGVIIPYSFHNSSLATIENSAEIVKIQEDYKSRLKAQLDTLPKVDGALMNSDSPYRSIISEIAISEQKIVTANEEILSAKMSIQKRERGLTSYILWFF